MNSNLDYALASARATELARHMHENRVSHHGSIADRLRRRREGARRARARHWLPTRLRAA